MKKVPIPIAIAIIALAYLSSCSSYAGYKQSTQNPPVFSSATKSPKVTQSPSASQPPEPQVSEDAVPALTNQEYVDYVIENVSIATNDLGFVVYRTAFHLPYLEIYLIPGALAEDGSSYTSTVVSATEYEDMLPLIKENVIEILSGITYVPPTSIFSPTIDYVSILFHESKDLLPVGAYQIDIQKFYCGEENYIQLETFSDTNIN